MSVNENTEVTLWWRVDGKKVDETLLLKNLKIKDKKLMGNNESKYQYIEECCKDGEEIITFHPQVKTGENYMPLACYVRQQKICFTNPQLNELFKDIGDNKCGPEGVCGRRPSMLGGKKRKTSKKSHRKSSKKQRKSRRARKSRRGRR